MTLKEFLNLAAFIWIIFGFFVPITILLWGLAVYGIKDLLGRADR